MSSLLRCLRLYAAPIVAVILGLTVELIGTSPEAIGFRLVAIGVSLAISFRELRNGRRRKREH